MHDFVFSVFLKEIFLHSIFEQIVSKGSKTKAFVNTFFDVIVTKYTLRVLLAFTV